MILAVLLAQAENVPGDFIKNSALEIAAVAATAYYLKEMFWPKQPEKIKQPFEVVAAKDYVHKDEFITHVENDQQAHRDLFSKIGGVERGARQHMDEKFAQLQSSAEEGREKLHHRLNQILTAVSEQKGTLDEMRRRHS